jgi:GPH family glycoside/pentoside/hexuronide:cation symporter
MFGVALSYQAFIGWIQFFYLDVLGLAPLAMSFAWTLFTLWNMVNDPLAGQLSDRTRTRWGKRIPWIAALSVPLGISFVLLWTPPGAAVSGGGRLFGALWWYFLAVLLLFDSLWSAITINYVALFPQMYPEQAQRAAVSGWRQMFSILAVIIGITFTAEIAQTIGWGRMGLLLGGLTTLAFLVSLAGSWERPITAEKELPIMDSLRLTFASRSFRWFILMNISVEFVLLVLPAIVPLYAKYVLGENDGLRQGMLSGAAFLVAIPSFALWTWSAKRWGSRVSLIASLALFGIFLIPLAFVRTFTQAISVTGILGIGLAGLMMLRDIMLADVIDEDAMVSGARREGMFFGMNGFVIRAAFAFQGILIGSMLAMTGYNPNLPDQPAAVATGLRALMVAAPWVGVAVGLFAAWYYPLHGELLNTVKARVYGQPEAVFLDGGE